MSEPSTRRLYRVVAVGYAWAASPDEAQEVIETEASLSDLLLSCAEAEAIEPEWEECEPYGADDDRTCAELLQAQREAPHAAELATFVDANQLPLGGAEE